MKKLLLLFLPLSLLVACGESTGPDASELAAQSAKVYYEQLLQGDYASFVDGTYRTDSIPKSYREQLIANAKMFVGQQNDEHHGIKEVRVIRSQTRPMTKSPAATSTWSTPASRARQS